SDLLWLSVPTGSLQPLLPPGPLFGLGPSTSAEHLPSFCQAVCRSGLIKSISKAASLAQLCCALTSSCGSPSLLCRSCSCRDILQPSRTFLPLPAKRDRVARLQASGTLSAARERPRISVREENRRSC